MTSPGVGAALGIGPLQGLPFPSAGVGFLLFIVILVFFIGFFVAWMIAVVWVYRDARRQGMDTPALWALVVFMGSYLGLIVYILVREGVISGASSE